MTAIAERRMPARPARIELDGLKMRVGFDEGPAFESQLEPEQAIALGHELIANAVSATNAAVREATIALDAITKGITADDLIVPYPDDLKPWNGHDA